eukprot:s4998_g3.t2
MSQPVARSAGLGAAALGCAFLAPGTSPEARAPRALRGASQAPQPRGAALSSAASSTTSRALPLVGAGLLGAGAAARRSARQARRARARCVRLSAAAGIIAAVQDARKQQQSAAALLQERKLITDEASAARGHACSGDLGPQPATPAAGGAQRAAPESFRSTAKWGTGLSHAAERLGEFDSQGLANTGWGCAALLSVGSSPRQALSPVLRRRISGFSAQGPANTARTSARLIQEDGEMLDAAATQLLT